MKLCDLNSLGQIEIIDPNLLAFVDGGRAGSPNQTMEANSGCTNSGDCTDTSNYGGCSNQNHCVT